MRTIKLTICFFENPAALHEIKAWESLKFKNIIYKNVKYVNEKPFGNFCTITYVVCNEEDDYEILLCLESIHNDDYKTWTVGAVHSELILSMMNILDIDYSVDLDEHGGSMLDYIASFPFELEFYKVLWFGKMEYDLDVIIEHLKKVVTIMKTIFREMEKELPEEIKTMIHKLKLTEV